MCHRGVGYSVEGREVSSTSLGSKRAHEKGAYCRWSSKKKKKKTTHTEEEITGLEQKPKSEREIGPADLRSPVKSSGEGTGQTVRVHLRTVMQHCVT